MCLWFGQEKYSLSLETNCSNHDEVDLLVSAEELITQITWGERSKYISLYGSLVYVKLLVSPGKLHISKISKRNMRNNLATITWSISTTKCYNMHTNKKH